MQLLAEIKQTPCINLITASLWVSFQQRLHLLGKKQLDCLVKCPSRVKAQEVLTVCYESDVFHLSSSSLSDTSFPDHVILILSVSLNSLAPMEPMITRLRISFQYGDYETLWHTSCTWPGLNGRCMWCGLLPFKPCRCFVTCICQEFHCLCPFTFISFLHGHSCVRSGKFRFFSNLPCRPMMGAGFSL